MGEAAAFARGCDLSLATPVRLAELVDCGHLALEAVRFLVLDKADVALSVGLEPEIRKLMTGCGMPSSLARQTVIVSTQSFPALQAFACSFLHDCIQVSVGPAVNGAPLGVDARIVEETGNVRFVAPCATEVGDG